MTDEQKDKELAKIADYKKLYEDLKGEHLEMIRGLRNCRAEAIREFAERLKKELNITGNGGWFEIGESGLIGAIDDLVKEMTEEK